MGATVLWSPPPPPATSSSPLPSVASTQAALHVLSLAGDLGGVLTLKDITLVAFKIAFLFS